MHSSNIQKKYVFARDWLGGGSGGRTRRIKANKFILRYAPLRYWRVAVKIYVLIFP